MAAPEPEGVLLPKNSAPETVSAPALLTPPPAAATPPSIVIPLIAVVTPGDTVNTPDEPLPLTATNVAPGPWITIGRLVLVRAIAPRPMLMTCGVAKAPLV